LDRARAYAALAEELEQWRHLPFNDLAGLISRPPSVKSIVVGNEVVDVEISVRWTGSKPHAIQVEAVANGPSCYRLERLEESVIVKATDSPSATDPSQEAES
jgi:hypothetical protein